MNPLHLKPSVRRLLTDAELVQLEAITPAQLELTNRVYEVLQRCDPRALAAALATVLVTQSGDADPIEEAYRYLNIVDATGLPGKI